jgi:hypothetical protein
MTAPALTERDYARVEGIDVSQYQLLIDWTRVPDADAFAIIKLAEGTTRDPFGALNWARSVGRVPRAGAVPHEVPGQRPGRVRPVRGRGGAADVGQRPLGAATLDE